MKFREKKLYLDKLKADICIVQECESPQNLLKNKDIYINASFNWYGNNPHKGLGIFTNNQYSLKLAECYSEEYKWVVPLVVTGKFNFNLIAIWAKDVPANKKLSYVGQIYLAIKQYSNFIQQRDTIIIGDFNSNKIWDKIPRVGNHSDLVNLLNEMNIISSYQAHFNELHGGESQNTFFQYRKSQYCYHIDYCFMSMSLLKNLTEFKVHDIEEWKKMSDHVPILIEIQD